MKNERTGTAKQARFASSVLGLYAFTLLFGLYLFNPGMFISAQPALSNTPSQPVVPEQAPIIVGRPVRIVFPRLAIDMQVTDGRFNPADKSWTLSDYGAHFAMPSMLANDYEGNTVIYGHNNNKVFGPLKALGEGDTAEVYTDNGHLFKYTYQFFDEISPEDVSAFHYQGLPVLTVQTCSGNWNEWRKMYRFGLTEVVR